MLKQYEHHYNSPRPHRGIDLHAPDSVGSDAAVVPLRQIRRTKVAAALINEYSKRAA